MEICKFDIFKQEHNKKKIENENKEEQQLNEICNKKKKNKWIYIFNQNRNEIKIDEEFFLKKLINGTLKSLN